MIKYFKEKKNIAKEILIFFSIPTIAIIVFGFFLIRNEYFNWRSNNTKVLREISESIQSVKNHPMVFFESYYSEIRENMVVVVDIDGKKYNVSSKIVNIFLSNFKSAVSMPPNSKGFDYSGEGKLFIYYVDYRSFLQLILEDLEYINSLSNVFNNPKNASLSEQRERLISIGNSYEELFKDLNRNKENLGLLEFRQSYFNSQRFERHYIFSLTIKISLVLLLIFYPVRICIYAIFWAFKTLRNV